MNILFLTISRIDDINQRSIYTDLMREFIKRGNEVYIATPTERSYGKNTHLKKFDHCQILKIKTLNIQKTNVIEKGIGNLLLESQFSKAIKKYWGDIKFDLVLYSTPPITFNKVIENIKKQCGCPSYLMLKDIFPQNAIDLGMMKEGGFLYRMFRKKEQRLYEISDKIGCMSPANCEYVRKHNPEIEAQKVELCPNAIMPIDRHEISDEEKNELLSKLGIPIGKTLFIYGGNLGKPQGVDFLLKVLEANEAQRDSFILVIGNGTEFTKIKQWYEKNNPNNSQLLSALPKTEYDRLIQSGDVGLIFLDPRFTIPNFPSRLLSYLENKMPVLLATDANTDMGRIAESEGFGLWCESGNLESFMKNLESLAHDKVKVREMGKKGLDYLKQNCTVDKVADIILKPYESI